MVGENKKIKILYVITKSNWGGAQRYVYDLATNIPKKDFDVVVAIGGNGVLKNKLSGADIRTITLERLGRNINIYNDLATFFSLLKLLWKEKPDIIHLNSSKIGGMGTLAARLTRVKHIVFTAHGWAFNEARGILQKTAIKLLSWLTVALSHHTITVSEHDGKQGRAMLFVGKKITTIHNGISKIDFNDKESARNVLLGNKSSKLVEKTIWLGTIAELHRNKGTEYAIKALSHITKTVPDLTFVFIVIGEGGERENLENLIKKERLENKVFLVGHKEDASLLLSAFDIFLFPSIKEGLPYVLLEAGMAGLPIIATSVGGIPEIIDDMESGILIQPQNYKEIEKAIVFLLKNQEDGKQFSEKLHKKIIQEFSTQNLLQKTSEVYLF